MTGNQTSVSDLVPTYEEHDPGGTRRIILPFDWEVTATFGGNGNCYRYTLSHRWGSGPMVLWLMMNPSTADQRFLDPTVAKTARMAKLQGLEVNILATSRAIERQTKCGYSAWKIRSGQKINREFWRWPAERL